MNIFRLKDVLREKGVSGKDLALMVGVTEASISNLSKGDSIPRKQLLIDISKALDVDVRELFVSTKEPNKVDLLDDIIKAANKLKESNDNN